MEQAGFLAKNPLGFPSPPATFPPVKGRSLLVTLALVFAALTAGVTLLTYQYVQLTRSLNRSQAAIQQVEMRQNRLKALVAETADHARNNPELQPLLQSLGLRPQVTR